MVRRITPAVRCFLLAAGISFLFSPFVFSNDIQISTPSAINQCQNSCLAAPFLSKPMTGAISAVFAMSRFEIFHAESLLRKGRSVEYVNAVLADSFNERRRIFNDIEDEAIRKRIANGPVKFINYKTVQGGDFGEFIFENNPAELYRVEFSGYTGQYEIRRARSVSNELEKDISGSAANRPVSAAEDILYRTRIMSEHILSQKRLLRDLKNTVIVIRKGLAENIGAGICDTLSVVLSKSYQVMKQDLRRLLNGIDNIVEAGTASDMFRIANTILSEKNKKLILIDDGSLTGNLSPDAIRAQITQGEPGTNYCMIIACGAQGQPAAIIPYLNIKDMAMMGLAILSRDPSDRILFETAYMSFTGDREVPWELFGETGINWVVRAPQKAVRFDINKPDELRMLYRIFGEAT